MVRKDKKYTVLQNCLYVVKDAAKNYPLVIVCSLFVRTAFHAVGVHARHGINGH